MDWFKSRKLLFRIFLCLQENEDSTKKHHHRRQASIATTAEVNVFKPHPLNITFKVRLSEAAGATLSVTLYYLPALRFITVQTKLTDFITNGIAARWVLYKFSCRISSFNNCPTRFTFPAMYSIQITFWIVSFRIIVAMTKCFIRNPSIPWVHSATISLRICLDVAGALRINNKWSLFHFRWSNCH